MAIVDDRGRLFGRLNLLDAVLLVLLVGLVPLGYAAYALFREHPARITGISPSRTEQAPHLRVAITGENFRPYMRVSADNYQALDFVFKSTTEVEAPFADLPPGEYDIVLYDQAQERFRVPNALVVVPSALPPTEIVAVGAFGNLDPAGAAKITAGLELPDVGRVLAVGKPLPDLTQVFSSSALVGVPIPNAQRLPATVLFRCYVRAQQGRPHCVVNDAPVAAPNLMMLPTPLGKTPFQVELVRSSHPLESVPIRVRVAGHPSVLSTIRSGDVDLGGTTNELAAVARVAGVSAVQRLSESSGEIDIDVVVQLQRVNGIWLYDSLPLRAGSTIPLRTPRYDVRGLVTQIPPPDRTGGATQ
jgi:hypothetical protein